MPHGSQSQGRSQPLDTPRLLAVQQKFATTEGPGPPGPRDVKHSPGIPERAIVTTHQIESLGLVDNDVPVSLGRVTFGNVAYGAVQNSQQQARQPIFVQPCTPSTRAGNVRRDR